MYSQIAFVFLAIVGLTAAQPPKPKPKPPPHPPRCADVLLYDTFGDGWSSNVVFQAGHNVTYQLLDKFDSFNGTFPSDQQNCSTRVLHFCNDKEFYEFSVDAFNGTTNDPITVDNSGEVFWAVHYDRRMYYGTVGSSVVIKGPKVDFSDLYDESPRANECHVCNTSNTTSGLYITLKDARNNGWFSVGNSDVAGFRVPNVLSYPKYTVTASDGSQVAEGTLCRGEEVVCTESFKDGTYFIRFSGLSQGSESWEFCGTNGIIGEELQFSIAGGSCLPLSKTSNTEQCYSNIAPVGPHSVEVALDANEELFTTVSSNSHANSAFMTSLNYFIAGCFCAFIVAGVVMKNKFPSDFEPLPTESSRSMKSHNRLVGILNGNNPSICENA